jgi:hypothetical protein
LVAVVTDGIGPELEEGGTIGKFLSKWGSKIPAWLDEVVDIANGIQLTQDIPKDLKETKEFGRPHGQKVYRKGNKYYSPDADSHNGGKWKVFEKQGGKLKRVGTADGDLNIFKK